MVATLIEAFGEDCKWDSCTSREKVVDWDNYDNKSFTINNCNNSIFYSKNNKTYQNGTVEDGKCYPGCDTGSLINSVDKTCKESDGSSTNPGSLEDPICIGKLVDHSKSNNQLYCDIGPVPVNPDNNYFYTHIPPNIYKKCVWQPGVGSTSWVAKDECIHKDPKK